MVHPTVIHLDNFVMVNDVMKYMYSTCTQALVLFTNFIKSRGKFINIITT